MSFNITPEKDEDLNLLQISDLNTGIQVRILPEVGALLHEFSIPLGNRRINVINSYKNKADIKENYKAYKSAKLSPFVCRLAGGRYSFQGTGYEFENKFPDGSAIHGLLANKPFTVGDCIANSTEASVTLHYHYNKEDPAYPFEYKITVCYTLKPEGRLFLDSFVENISPVAIPMADGWHPYFKLEGKVNDWLLYFRSGTNIAFDEKLIPIGHTVKTDRYSSPRPIGDDFFDHCYLLDESKDSPAVTLENKANGLLLSLYPDNSYPYLQIYTPDDRKSIALENLSSAPDSFNNGMGLIILEPNRLQSFSVVYQLEFV